MKQTLLAVTLVLTLGACKSEKGIEKESQVKKEVKMELSIKDKTIAVLKSIETGDKEAVSYINPTKTISNTTLQ